MPAVADIPPAPAAGSGNRLLGSRRWWALGALALAMLAVGVDGTALSVALPTLSRELSASESDLQWICSGYLLVLAAAMLPAGVLMAARVIVFGGARLIVVGSLCGALTVAASAGGTTGPELARAARAAFMSGNRLSLVVAALVAAGGAILVLAGLPARTSVPERASG